MLCGFLVGWGSRGQKTVSLSSTEAEYITLAETCKENLFIIELLVLMGVKFSLPIIVRVDNMGSLFMETNGVGKILKHVDTHHHFIQNYSEKVIIKIIFIGKDENTTDEFTKKIR